MTKAPPENLLEWPKGELVKELQRLRAVMREHAERTHDDARSGGNLVDVAGDPFARSGVVIDAREAVLLDEMDVSLVDTKRDEPPAMALLLAGRVNYANRRTRQLYLFGPDGAAGLVTQIVALAQRAGGDFETEFKQAFKDRMKEMP